MALGQFIVHSRALGRDVPFNVYIPDRGTFLQGRFPAILQLHGRYGSFADWIVRTKLAVYLLDLPLIAIVPDGAGAESGWSNWLVPGQRYEDFIMQDLIPACEYLFPIESGRWAVGGNSMGGYGALLLGLKHPDTFASIYAHSSVVFRSERVREQWPELTADKVADADLYTHAAAQVDNPTRPILGLDCGTDDRIISMSRDFHACLDQISYPHQYHEFSGGHDWTYWDTHLPRALAQHLKAFDLAAPALPSFH